MRRRPWRPRTKAERGIPPSPPAAPTPLTTAGAAACAAPARVRLSALEDIIDTAWRWRMRNSQPPDRPLVGQLGPT
jgi:hypothetical protein